MVKGRNVEKYKVHNIAPLLLCAARQVLWSPPRYRFCDID